MADKKDPDPKSCCGGKGTGRGADGRFSYYYRPTEYCGGGSIKRGNIGTWTHNGQSGRYELSSNVTVDFIEPCACCSYRQCVYGYMKYSYDGKNWFEQDPPTYSWGEDVAGDGSVYGERGKDNATSKYTSSCSFWSVDAPGIGWLPNRQYCIYLKFKGVIFDTCKQIVQDEWEWVVKTDGAQPPVNEQTPIVCPGSGGGGTTTLQRGWGTSHTHSTATIRLEDGNTDIRIYVNDQGSKVMSIGRVQKPNEAATPVSAVQATLFMQDGSVIKPQPFPGTDAMVSVSIGHGPSKETLPFDLKNVNLDQVQEVQIDFRGKTSPRTKLKGFRIVERLVR